MVQIDGAAGVRRLAQRSVILQRAQGASNKPSVALACRLSRAGLRADSARLIACHVCQRRFAVRVGARPHGAERAGAPAVGGLDRTSFPPECGQSSHPVGRRSGRRRGSGFQPVGMGGRTDGQGAIGQVEQSAAVKGIKP